MFRQVAEGPGAVVFHIAGGGVVAGDMPLAVVVEIPEVDHELHVAVAVEITDHGVGHVGQPSSQAGVGLEHVEPADRELAAAVLEHVDVVLQRADDHQLVQAVVVDVVGADVAALAAEVPALGRLLGQAVEELAFARVDDDAVPAGHHDILDAVAGHVGRQDLGPLDVKGELDFKEALLFAR